MKRIMKKLNSQSGESLSETLFALLVAAIALTMLAGMITATVNIVTKSEDTMDAYYKESWKLEEIADGSGPINLSVTSESMTGSVDIKIDGIQVYSAKNETFQRTPVTAYRPATVAGGGA